MPNVMVALPNTGDALCSMPQSLADAHSAKTRNLLKFAGVPQTTGWISAVSRPRFTILWTHVEVISVLNKFFFPIVDMCLSCEDIARQSCAMVPTWRFSTFLRPAFPASRVQQVSDLHLKLALRPHHVWKYGRHPIYGR